MLVEPHKVMQSSPGKSLTLYLAIRLPRNPLFRKRKERLNLSPGQSDTGGFSR